MHAGEITDVTEMPSNSANGMQQSMMDQNPPRESGMTVASAFESLLTAENASVQQAKPKGNKKRRLILPHPVVIKLEPITIQDDYDLPLTPIYPFPLTIAAST